jgi:Spy/CpxP family protein refolding chaperone
MMAWWHARRGQGHGGWHAEAGCGHGHEGHEGHHEGWSASAGDFDGGFGAFGVRRPLRFLAHKLDLTEAQVAGLARILNDLKTERAQAAVDGRRTLSALADLVEGEAFDEAKAKAAAGTRVTNAERLRDAVAKALGQIHALLQPAQRTQLAYLIRTGALLI